MTYPLVSRGKKLIKTEYYKKLLIVQLFRIVQVFDYEKDILQHQPESGRFFFSRDLTC